jgi:hypothetical protein
MKAEIANREERKNIQDELMMALSSFETEDDFSVIDDRYRVWSLNNSNALKAFRNIPRKWSQNVASQGAIVFNKETGVSTVSKEFAKAVKLRYSKLKNELNKYARYEDFVPSVELSNKQAIEELFKDGGLRSMFLDLLHTMGMQADNRSLDILMQQFGEAASPHQQINYLHKLIFADKAGSIRSFVEQLNGSAGQSEFMAVGRSNRRELDELYNNYKESSDIAKLAISYNEAHPASSEFSVRGANGEMLYPVGQNNFVTDRVTELMDGNVVSSLSKSPYCKHSVLLNAAKKASNKDSRDKI